MLMLTSIFFFKNDANLSFTNIDLFKKPMLRKKKPMLTYHLPTSDFQKTDVIKVILTFIF